jgi:hypothetical protein
MKGFIMKKNEKEELIKGLLHLANYIVYSNSSMQLTVQGCKELSDKMSNNLNTELKLASECFIKFIG